MRESFPVICLMGPTGSGKTGLAIKLVQQFPLEIVSVDSAMVYRGMDIGTAKPDRETLALAPHRLLDIRDPSEPYSAAQFREDALQAIDEIIQQKKIPLLVGGTMLYFHALQQGLSDLPSADPVIRKKIIEEAKQSGWPALHARLADIDPVAASRIHPHDRQRIQRALEVSAVTGKNLTALHQGAPGGVFLPYRFYNLAIAPLDRGILHERIAVRFRQMLEDGLIEEVRQLQARGDLSPEMPSMRAVGYRQVLDYLSGALTRAELEMRGIIATRQLAKRQLTWLRAMPDVTWLDSEAGDLYEQASRYILNIIQSVGF